MKRVLFCSVAALSGAAALGFAGCSLGLDESKLLIVEAGALADRAPLAPPGPDVVVAADADALATKPDTGVCDADEACSSANGCITGSCDTARHACVYEVCPQSACRASACDTARRACSPPAAYGFHAGSFKVSGAIGCNGAVRRCIAAAYPFVYVGTGNGIVGHSLVDPSSGAPASITVTGLPFLPSSMVASGSRVYFEGPVVGGGPAYKLSIAWVDAPTDPLATTIEAHTAFLDYSYAAIQAMYASAPGSVLLVAASPMSFFPSAQLTAPLRDLATVAVFPNAGIPMQAVPVAASGDRMVTYRWDGQTDTLGAFFGLETAAGTAAAQNAGEKSVAPSMGPVYSANAFAQGPDGSLIWSAPKAELGEAGGPVLRGVRMAWLLGDSSATQFDARPRVDVETYEPPVAWDTPVVGPIAHIDGDTALVLAATAGNLAQTSVQVATRAGTTAALAPSRRYVIPTAPDKLAATSTRGLGYVLAADAIDSATVHVFAPGCK